MPLLSCHESLEFSPHELSPIKHKGRRDNTTVQEVVQLWSPRIYLFLLLLLLCLLWFFLRLLVSLFPHSLQHNQTTPSLTHPSIPSHYHSASFISTITTLSLVITVARLSNNLHTKKTHIFNKLNVCKHQKVIEDIVHSSVGTLQVTYTHVHIELLPKHKQNKLQNKIVATDD